MACDSFASLIPLIIGHFRSHRRFQTAGFRMNKYLAAGDKPLTMALVVATWDGDTGLCKTLLDKGADPNAGPNDSSLRPRLIQAILAPTDSHEVRPEAEVPTPLVGALLQHHPETARLLLARGADPGRQSTFGSPYSLARKAGYNDVAILIHDDVR